MTQIQFLLDLVLNHELSKDVHDKILARIGEVEAEIMTSYNTNRVVIAPSKPARELSTAFVQAPSTQKLLEQNPDLAPVPQPVVPIPRGVLDKETGTERIPTGNGTQGPRKWK